MGTVDLPFQIFELPAGKDFYLSKECRRTTMTDLRGYRHYHVAFPILISTGVGPAAIGDRRRSPVQGGHGSVKCHASLLKDSGRFVGSNRRALDWRIFLASR